MQQDMSVLWKEVVGVTIGAAFGVGILFTAGQHALGFDFDLAVIATASLGLSGALFVMLVLGEIELRGVSARADWIMFGGAEFLVGFGVTLAVFSLASRLSGIGVTTGPALLVEAWWPAVVGGAMWGGINVLLLPDRLRRD
jgi:hypothetical protein